MRTKTLAWVLFALMLLPIPAHGQDSSGLRITNYVSDITVNPNASIDVGETIYVTFDTEHHGIFRDIPLHATFNGQQVNLPISDIAVSQDGHAVKISTSVTDQDVEHIKIGDPDVLIRGDHIYTIQYHVAAAVNFFADFDELNWNVTGNSWEVPIQAVSATVHLMDTSITPTASCYTGPVGSTAQNCHSQATPGQSVFTANDTLTVISHWPKGIVTQPSNYDRLRHGQSSRQILWAVLWIIAALIPVLAAGFMIRRWAEYGRDPAESSTVIAQYEPPADVRPAEAQVIMQENVNNRAVSATIIDLAVRGYLKITEISKPEFGGLSHFRDYALTQVKSADGDLRDYERRVLDVLFNMPEIKDDQGQTLVSRMKRKQSKVYIQIKAIMSAMSASVTTRGFFADDPRKIRQKYGAIGGGVAIAAYIVFKFSDVLPREFFIVGGGVGLAGLIIAVVGYFMPRRSATGAKADWQLKGFKLYLSTAEKYRLQWQEKQNMFETFLPYAMVFGVAEKWSKAFASMSLPPPSWYSGPAGQTWTSVYAWSALSHFNTAFAAVSIPSGGGSSGGGSGGGGGGGGGGGW